ncbi:MAG: PhzF family phenazine biosynthesis protein [Pseudonocardia sp.]|nr:PhzF family phenazine biosynthesis protein [Pseudonocardia sp.]
MVLDAGDLDAPAMQAIAADVGYSETAFLLPGADLRDREVRYFSPLAEVPFCGHATIATAVAHAERYGPGRLVLHTRSGPVQVTTVDGDGPPVATLVSVAPRVHPVAAADLDEALAALRWVAGELDPALPPRVAYAGASHLVLAAATRQRLARLDYDYDRLRALMPRSGWTTVQLVPRTGPLTFDSRNPFPPGGVYEDPATGAAAAAFGAYLADIGAADLPARVTIAQGVEMGRSSTLVVDIPADPTGGIAVSGAAVRLPA